MTTLNEYNWIKFSVQSLKARLYLAQEVLLNAGYDVTVNGKRDKQTIKALKKLQKEAGLGQNAVICEKTFEALKSL